MKYLLLCALLVSAAFASEPWAPGQSVSPNFVLAGPSSGVINAKPIPRALVLDDISTTVWSGFNGYGIDASKPSAVGREGYLYFSIDINGGTLYRSNGTTWNSLSGGGGGGISTATLPLVITGPDVALGTATGPATADVTSSVTWSPSGSASTALVLQGKPSQSAPLLELQDSTGTVLTYFSDTGRLFTPRIEGISSGGLDIDGFDATSGNNSGGSTTITSGNGFGTGNGGYFSIFSGGSGSGATGNGGGVQILAGNSNATNGNGGALDLAAGSGVGTGGGGATTLFGGSSDGDGGAVTVAAGNSVSATGGSVYLDAGTGSVLNGSVWIGSTFANTVGVGTGTVPTIIIGNSGSSTSMTGTFDFSGVVTFADDIRITFNPGAANSGLNVGAQVGDPSAPSDGDIWYESSGNQYRGRANGTTFVFQELITAAEPLLLSAGALNLGYVVAPTTADASADLIWSPSANTKKALVLQGQSGQSVNVFEVQDDLGTVNASISAGGTLYAPTIYTDTVTSSATSFSITNSNTDGTISIAAGNGSTNNVGGGVSIASGTGDGTGNGGTISLSGGSSGSGATGDGGNITFLAGQSLATNGNGGVVTLLGGFKAGTGDHGDVVLGTADIHRQHVRGSGLTLTDNSQALVLTMSVTSLRSGGGRIEFTVEAYDGSDVQSCNGVLRFNVVNKSGTFTSDTALTSSTLATAGTLTVTFQTGDDGISDFTLGITADTTGLTAPTLRVFYTVYNESGRIITVP